MTGLTGETRARYVREMFSQIAGRYDLMNGLMTGWQDRRWRAEVIARANLGPGQSLLDLGAGTGDLSQEARRRVPGVRTVSADFTFEMMRVGQQRQGPVLQWCAADALHLPLASETFDASVSGFLLRNVTDVGQTLREQYRVLKPGGRWVALDTTRPGRNLLYPFMQIHLHWIIPTLGGLLTGRREAYTYLPDSTEHFLSAEELAALASEAGFRDVGFARRMFGAVAVHWGVKSNGSS